MQKQIRRWHIRAEYRTARCLRKPRPTIYMILLLMLLIVVTIFFDLTCIPQSYEPRISFKHSPNTERQMRLISYDRWTAIVGPNILSIYSAFSHGQLISIIGLMDRSFTHLSLRCKLISSTSQSHWKETMATVEILSESWIAYYDFLSVRIVCQNTTFADYSKVRISFTVHEHMWETASVSVSRIAVNSSRLPVVCVRPLFGSFVSDAQLLEFIAFYRANGIEEFNFYDLSMTEHTKKLLRQMSFVRLLSFHLPIADTAIHAQGQVAAMNDCLLRAAGNIIINVDLDELVVVKSKEFTTIKEYISNKMKDCRIGALVIPNVMLCNEFNPVRSFPRILSAVVRQATSWRHGDRSKAIVLQPLSIGDLGIHTVWGYSDGNIVNENVAQEDAMLFHYRSCCRVWQPSYRYSLMGIAPYFLAYNDDIVTDSSISRFEVPIMEFLRSYVIF